MFWIISVGVAIVAALWITLPFLRKGAVEMNDSDGAISVFRDQLDELDRDLAAGLINEDQRDAAAQEIERRTLSAARHLDAGFTRSQRAPAVALGLAGLAAVVALGGYAWVGAPGVPDQPLAARKTELLEQRAAQGDANARIALMIARTEENPQSFEDWWTLAVSYSSLGNHASAVDAYRQAAELAPDEPGVQAAYAEAMVQANGNKVPQMARIIFENVMLETADPRARYYVALSKAQEQDFDGALASWVALKNDSPEGASWLPMVRRDIVNMVRFLKRDLADYLPDATQAEIAAAGGAPASEIDATRIAELEAQLSTDPLDHSAWIELATRLAQSGDNEKAATVLTQGAAHFAAAPFVQQKFDEAAQNLGMDILEPEPDQISRGGVANPSAEDVANISALPQAEQDDMISGMVAGLAAELEESPENPEKWVMLVRSYSVLGDPDRAKAAYDQAKALFAGNGPVLDMMSKAVADVISE
ncbi:c-type cytochrome biogenesis protein CcmI [Aliiroseovarius subalbicans]|uniref:c-type cytochrome biogenesis protein CcmI n=1 Tax=Aliiroseovarius subalbicans TaxID=2925840 RepID=UPI001F587E2B|nr:c-type cytochrome biogenesis protein CcmI [Aliiroseovarius subalbicans]MCI2399644.1 c-type cytochrome biogenesis protein CcmI [Aliiroseovarius subalbicans]